MNYEKDLFRIGLWFRSSSDFEQTAYLNAIVFLVSYKFKNILINYSLDISTSRFLASTGRAHEVSVAYTFNLYHRGKKTRMRAVPCPNF